MSAFTKFELEEAESAGLRVNHNGKLFRVYRWIGRELLFQASDIERVHAFIGGYSIGRTDADRIAESKGLLH